jgi:hypothetical protein
MTLMEVFQDVDGGTSMKRVVFLLVLIIIAVLALGPMWWHLDDKVLEYCKDALAKVIGLETWLGGFILAERAPAAMASFKGNPTAAVTKEPTC